MALFLCADLCRQEEYVQDRQGNMMASDDSGSENSREAEERIVDNLDDSTANVRVVLFKGHNKFEWMFLAMSVLNCASLITIGIIEMAKTPNPKTLICFSEYPGALIIATAFVALLFAVYGMWCEHQYDMYFHCFWTLVSCAMVWINIDERHKHGSVDTFTAVLLSLACASLAFWLPSMMFSMKATSAPDWIEFRLIGVSDSLAAMYKVQQRFLAILKSYSIFIVFGVLYSADRAFSYMQSPFKYIFYGVSALFALLNWILGRIAVQKENIYLTYGFYFVNMCFLVSNIAGVAIWMRNIVANGGYVCKLCSNGKDDALCFVSLALVTAFPIWIICLIYQLKRVQRGYGFGLHNQSFLDLVSRDSNHLLANKRASLVF